MSFKYLKFDHMLCQSSLGRAMVWEVGTPWVSFYFIFHQSFLEWGKAMMRHMQDMQGTGVILSSKMLFILLPRELKWLICTYLSQKPYLSCQIVSLICLNTRIHFQTCHEFPLDLTNLILLMLSYLVLLYRCVRFTHSISRYITCTICLPRCSNWSINPHIHYCSSLLNKIVQRKERVFFPYNLRDCQSLNLKFSCSNLFQNGCSGEMFNWMMQLLFAFVVF